MWRWFEPYVLVSSVYGVWELDLHNSNQVWTRCLFTIYCIVSSGRPDDGPVTGPKHVVYKSNKYYTTIFSCVRLLLPLHHIMYTTGMLQLKIKVFVFKSRHIFKDTVFWDVSVYNLVEISGNKRSTFLRDVSNLNQSARTVSLLRRLCSLYSWPSELPTSNCICSWYNVYT